MPYESVYVPAELFMEHKGVKVYHVYKDNNIEEGTRTFYYSLQEDSDDYGSDAFDVRELPNSASLGNLKDDIKRAIANAIDEGHLVAPI